MKLPTQIARGVVFAIFHDRQLVVEMPTYPLQDACLAVIAGTPALAAVFVALRIYTRRKLNLRLGLGTCLHSIFFYRTDRMRQTTG
jgi:hypothetical protein